MKISQRVATQVTCRAEAPHTPTARKQLPRYHFQILVPAMVLLLAASPIRADLLLNHNPANGPEGPAIMAYDEATGAFLRRFTHGGGSEEIEGFTFGPDGNLYVSVWAIGMTAVHRYDGNTGEFLGTFVPWSEEVARAFGLTFGPDGNLYVAIRIYDEMSLALKAANILRFDGTNGAALGAFVADGVGGLTAPFDLAFGPDGNLYVSDERQGVLRYNGYTGAFMGALEGLGSATGLGFGPDGHLYVSSGISVLRYDGTNGAFIDIFATADSEVLPFLFSSGGLTFGPDGNLYVCNASYFYWDGALFRCDGRSGGALRPFVRNYTGSSGPHFVKFTAQRWSGCEGFESGWNGWSTDLGLWEIGPQAGAHTGTNCAGTVLGGVYPYAAESRLISPIMDLPTLWGNEVLTLRFWQWFSYWYGYGNDGWNEWWGGVDHGDVQIQVYTNTLQWSSWTNLLSVSRYSGVWAPAEVDLSAYAGKRVRVGFYHTDATEDMNTNGGTHHYESSGWHIDDVCIEKRQVAVLPFAEGFEQGWNGWSADTGVWAVGSQGGAHSGTNCVGTVLGGNYPWETDSRLISPVIDLPSLTAGEEIVLRFWQWFSYWYGYWSDGCNSGWSGNDYGVIEVQAYIPNTREWSTWTTLSGVSRYSGVWAPAQVDLTAYAGRRIRLGFNHTDITEDPAPRCGSGGAHHYESSGWYLDDVSIEKRFVPVLTGPELFEDDWKKWYTDQGVWEMGPPIWGPGVAHSGTNCAGTVLGGNYPVGSWSGLISPVVELPKVWSGEPLMLCFWEWLRYTGSDYGYVQIRAYVTNGGWSSWFTLGTEPQFTPAWSRTCLDLAAYSGRLVQLAFRHTDSIENVLGDAVAPGWYVDDVFIKRGSLAILPIAGKTVDERATLTFQVQVIGADPWSCVSFRLPWAPPGAQIDPETGVFTWTPSACQGPGIYNIPIYVVDYCNGKANDLAVVQVIVNEVNEPPWLMPHTNTVAVLQTNLIPLVCWDDPDCHRNLFSFTLLSGTPAGTSIDNSGVFRWVPTLAQLRPEPYVIGVRLCDNGTPSYCVTNTLGVTVTADLRPSTTLEVPSGYSALTLLLDCPSNAVAQILTNVPEGLLLYRFSQANQSYGVNQFELGAWSRPDEQLMQGEAVLIRNPSAPFSVTFAVAASPTQFPMPSLAPGWNLVGQTSCQPSPELPALDGDEAQMIDTNGNFSSYFYIEGFGWFPELLVPYGSACFYAPHSLGTGPAPQCGTVSIYLNNYVLADGIDASITNMITGGRATGPCMVAQLYAGPVRDSFSMSPVGAPVPFYGFSKAGYIDASANLIRCLRGPEDRFLQVRIWDSSRWPSYPYPHMPWFDTGCMSSTVEVPEQPQNPLAPPLNLIGLHPCVYGCFDRSPLIEIVPNAALVWEGQMAAFSVRENWYSCTPPARTEFQWQKWDDGLGWRNISGATSAWFSIGPATVSDSGRYGAIVRHECDSPSFPTCVLTVLPRPRFAAWRLVEPSGGMELRLTAPSGRSYDLQESTNLVDWTFFQAITNLEGSCSVWLTNQASPSTRFYRLLALPR